MKSTKCHICGKDFLQKQKTEKYCSSHCALEGAEAKRKERVSKQSEYVARLSIKEMPRKKEAKKRLACWLRKRAEEIEDGDLSQFLEQINFRLMK